MGKVDICMKIRPTVLTLFILLTGIIIAISLSLQYYFLKELAFNATDENMTHISEKIEQKIKNLDEKNNNIISNLELYKSIHDIPKKDERHPLLPLIANTLNNNKFIYAIYVGTVKGSFYEVINLDIDKKLREKYNASKDMKWLVIKIYTENEERVQYEEFLDSSLKQIKSKRSLAIYDPSVRPWFIEARQTHKIIKTDPYMYTNLEAKGTTYAKEVPNSNCVLGVDVSLTSMSNFLKTQLLFDDSEIYLFRDKDKVTANANQGENYKNLDFEELRKKLITTNKSSSSKILEINEKKYFTYFSKLDSSYDKKEYLTVLLPLQKIMEPYNKDILISSITTLLILLLSTPLVWLATKMLAVPIQNLANENRKIIDRKFKDVVFVKTNIKELDDLSRSLVKLSISMQKYEKDQKELMDSFIKIIASAIDAKSKYTGGHCERVPELSMMIAQAASNDKEVFKDFIIKNEDEKRELNIAAWLHDCGKVTTPEYVVDKATKLETIYNRIHEIRTRFEVLHRDMTIQTLTNIINGANEKEEEQKLQDSHKKLHEEYECIANANIGGEFMDKEDIEKIKEISKRTWTRNFDNSIGLSRDERERLQTNKNNTTPQVEKILDDKIEHIVERELHMEKEYEKYGMKLDTPEHMYNFGEIYNLSIKKGTLTNEERYKINEHIMMSIVMLEQLPFLENLKRVPEYAVAHHETLIGTGYPRKLTKDQMSVPARILAVADVFEALTSSDRPYKEAKTLSESIKILSFMVKDQHLDKDIFEMFLKTGIYKDYAHKFLLKEQIDEVDISKYI